MRITEDRYPAGEQGPVGPAGMPFLPLGTSKIKVFYYKVKNRIQIYLYFKKLEKKVK